jgi:hypothetical protein
MTSLSQRLRGYVKLRVGVVDGMDLINAANALEELHTALSQARDLIEVAAGWVESNGNTTAKESEWLRNSILKLDAVLERASHSQEGEQG